MPMSFDEMRADRVEQLSKLQNIHYADNRYTVSDFSGNGRSR